jgi:hypothetical protein
MAQIPRKTEGDFTVGDIVKLKGSEQTMVVDSFETDASLRAARSPEYGGGMTPLAQGPETATEYRVKCIWMPAHSGAVMEHSFWPHHLELVTASPDKPKSGDRADAVA